MRQPTASLSIKNWSEADRPREKLVRHGKTVLSDTELLAILLGSGSRHESALDLARRILGDNDHNLGKLGRLSIHQLMSYKGVGQAKAVLVSAAMEMGRRRQMADTGIKSAVKCSRDVFELLQPVLGELPHEEFWIVYLNNANKVIFHSQLSRGGITGTLVDVRLVLKKALELGAVALILAHNHPSGTLKPSAADKQLTEKLKKAAVALDIKVLDHLIITETNFFSFADENIL
ncbi:RadC family protein [Zeaxanthinibacter enoshimensis]|uniref:DNA repair protein RadC n=1 Tax=Zeaxanthinibacter enoshimensis TaxID=392009 RepID=A0A4R6TFA5_9FLAO|nr:DNA repair protein RadC [Zeaxanthinibacter enoshimensis]TDQ28975.1 DNA repair protein RadC [Zeaxanthinibacter enoshimensis]